MSDSRIIQKGEIYRHFKGNLYQIVAIAKDSETQQAVVVYQALYGEMGIWTRPYDMCVSEVDRAKYPNAPQKYRFELVSNLACNSVSAVQPAVNVQSKTSDNSKQGASSEEGQPDPRLIAFLDTDTYKEKLEQLSILHKNMDDRLINDIAAALDLTVDEGELEKRFLSLKSCIETLARFECNRLR